jgi:hypothetical protein
MTNKKRRKDLPETLGMKDFDPISETSRKDDATIDRLIGALQDGRIGIVPLFDCDPALFAELTEECRALAHREGGQSLDKEHPTYQYVKKQSPDWDIEPGTVRQYSLYNSRHDYRYTGDDHHWSDADRRFNRELKATPRFFERYFGTSDLQNFRMQTIAAGGGLGIHKELILGIPKREDHYKLRFHLPIVTNDSVHFIMDDVRYRMAEGTVYIFNQGRPHGVENADGQLRIHLVWDCYLNRHILFDILDPAVAARDAA